MAFCALCLKACVLLLFLCVSLGSHVGPYQIAYIFGGDTGCSLAQGLLVSVQRELLISNISKPTDSLSCSSVWQTPALENTVLLSYPNWQQFCHDTDPCPAVLATKNAVMPKEDHCYNLVTCSMTYKDGEVGISSLAPLTVYCSPHFRGLQTRGTLARVGFESWTRKEIQQTLDRMLSLHEVMMDDVKKCAAGLNLKADNTQASVVGRDVKQDAIVNNDQQRQGEFNACPPTRKNEVDEWFTYSEKWILLSLLVIVILNFLICVGMAIYVAFPNHWREQCAASEFSSHTGAGSSVFSTPVKSP